jgi:hypothetical protein
VSDDAEAFEDTFEPWTENGATRLADAAQAVQAAVALHARALVAANGDDEAVFKASEDLLPVLLAYADAQVDFTGYGFPFGPLAQFVDDDDAELEVYGDDWPTRGISVVQRHDYVVADEAAVLTAGRQAYLRTWPDDDVAAAAADVTHVGRALYQLAHADGWNSLYKAPGLDAVGGFIAVVRQEELFGPDPDEWAAEVLDEDAELLYSQSDIYRAP